MAERHYLVLPVSRAAQPRVRQAIMQAGGAVLFAAASGVLVARLSDGAKGAVAGRYDVRHCGGVDIAPRPIRRIRVDQSGNRIGP